MTTGSSGRHIQLDYDEYEPPSPTIDPRAVSHVPKITAGKWKWVESQGANDHTFELSKFQCF